MLPHYCEKEVALTFVGTQGWGQLLIAGQGWGSQFLLLSSDIIVGCLSLGYGESLNSVGFF